MRNRLTTGQRGARAAPLLLLALLLLPGVARGVDPNSNQEQRLKKQEEKKVEIKAKPAASYWSVDALFETHFTVIRDNEYSNDAYHILYMRGNLDVPELGPLPALGRLTLRLDVTRRYVADPEESGFLFGDIALYWSRQFKFDIKGQKLGVRPYAMWTFPTSKIADKEGNVARPTVLVAVSKPLPFNLLAFVRPYGRLNWDRYAERIGGQANVKWQLGYDVQLLYSFHLHEPLTFGASIGQEWDKRYESRDGMGQPWISEYFWEVFAGYKILEEPVAFSAYLTLASGRRTWEDGVWRFHFVDRDETEVYLSLSARY